MFYRSTLNDIVYQVFINLLDYLKKKKSFTYSKAKQYLKNAL